VALTRRAGGLLPITAVTVFAGLTAIDALAATTPVPLPHPEPVDGLALRPRRSKPPV